MKRTVGAALILLTFTATACSGSEPARSWSDFESCIDSFRLSDGDTVSVSVWREYVEVYREAGFEGQEMAEFFRRTLVECEKVMPLTD